MLFDAGTVVGLSDGQLLDLFATRRDETAFTALVERHGPMVRRVCGEVLGNHHDAEDAFQATFLVLARQVGSIRRRDSVASWLYGVALRVSACARSASSRQRLHERNWATLRAAQLSTEGESREDFGPLVHAEIGRLAARFRAPVVLCCLEGRTYEEAARLLRCPLGTIKSRLATARLRLRHRLERLEPAWLTGSIERDQGIDRALIAVPARLVETTVRAATQGTAGGVVPVSVVRLVEGVLKAMLLSRLSTAAIVLIVVAALATGASGWSRSAKGRPAAVEARVDNPPQTNPGGRAPEAQAPARDSNLTNLVGRVDDDHGRHLADALVVFFAPRAWDGNGDPVEVQAKTDASGEFHLAYPPVRRIAMDEAHIWAYRPGSAIAVTPRFEPSASLVLRHSQPRTVKVEGPDGRPVPGAILMVINIAPGGDWPAEMPETLARPRAATTGTDGKATIDYLAGGDQLIAVRITAPSIGTQNLELIKLPGRDPQAETITIRLKMTSHLAGHVRNSSGEPVAGQSVEVWARGGSWLPPNLIGFKNGPLRTATDGSFRTPDNLFVGSQYRMVVRAPGFEPILSRWITIGERPRGLLPMVMKPLRTVSGRVADRQGKPVANVEVFQSGDGPERTATKTDGDGRFALGGFRQGSVFLFARGEGFRFFGRLINPSDGDIAVELTRSSEQPVQEMRMLPEPIPLEESRALARRLIEPCWEAAVAQKNQDAAGRALQYLAAADPVGALQQLENEDIAASMRIPQIKREVARALARTDVARAEKVAESIDSPNLRSAALVAVVDALPADDRERKLALLTLAAVHARTAKSQYQAAEVAERWYELGEKDKAKSLFAEGIRMRPDTPLLRGRFAARLARVDLPAAMAIARELPIRDRNFANQVYWNIALRLAAENPPEAERVLRLAPQTPGRRWLSPAIVWKMAATDPARARRLVDESQRQGNFPQTYLFLALGLKARDPVAADEAFWKAMEGIDRLMEEGTESSGSAVEHRVLLPLVEQINPTLVPEVFWRAVAMRSPIGKPHSLIDESPSHLVFLLAWYNREVAAALFEPVRALMEKTDDRELAELENPFLEWSIFDPRAAVARLEQTPIAFGNRISSSERVAELLGLSYEDRWRRVWTDHTDMRFLLERDIR